MLVNSWAEKGPQNGADRGLCGSWISCRDRIHRAHPQLTAPDLFSLAHAQFLADRRLECRQSLLEFDHILTASAAGTPLCPMKSAADFCRVLAVKSRL